MFASASFVRKYWSR